MPGYINNKILIVGSGNMAVEYAKVLAALGVPYICVGRGVQNAKSFEDITAHDVICGGIEKYVGNAVELPDTAIITVNADCLEKCAVLLMRAGVSRLLIEKPAGLTVSEIENVAKCASVNFTEAYVAYNRRFYASTIAAEKIIEQDGGVESFCFEFTEWLHTIGRVNSKIFSNWLFANSSHVLDFAFYLGGRPRIMTGYAQKRALKDDGAHIFSGAGITESNALFSYSANWSGPGRWSLEFITKSSRLIFKPLEQLYIQRLKSTDIIKVPLDDRLDISFKPGLFLQTQTFLSGESNLKLLNIHRHLENAFWYKKIRDGT